MGKRLLCILFFGIGLLRAQTPEELLLKIYAEELETVRQSRLEYVLNTHGVIDFEGETAAALDEAVIRELNAEAPLYRICAKDGIDEAVFAAVTGGN